MSFERDIIADLEAKKAVIDAEIAAKQTEIDNYTALTAELMIEQSELEANSSKLAALIAVLDTEYPAEIE